MIHFEAEKEDSLRRVGDWRGEESRLPDHRRPVGRPGRFPPPNLGGQQGRDHHHPRRRRFPGHSRYRGARHRRRAPAYSHLTAGTTRPHCLGQPGPGRHRRRQAAQTRAVRPPPTPVTRPWRGLPDQGQVVGEVGGLRHRSPHPTWWMPVRSSALITSCSTPGPSFAHEQARTENPPLLHHTRDATWTHPTAVTAALAVTRHLQNATGTTITRIVHELEDAKTRPVAASYSRSPPLTMTPFFSDSAIWRLRRYCSASGSSVNSRRFPATSERTSRTSAGEA